MTFRSLWNQYRFLVPIIISNKNNTSIHDKVHLNYGNSTNRKKIQTPKSNKKYLLISNGHYYYCYCYILNYLALMYTGATYLLSGHYCCCCYYNSSCNISLLAYKTSWDKTRHSLCNVFVPEKQVFFALHKLSLTVKTTISSIFGRPPAITHPHNWWLNLNVIKYL